MNKVQLIEKLFATGSFSTKSAAEEACDLVFDSIKEAVKKGEKVSIGGFGIFSKKHANARTARNPKTGESVQVAAHSKVKFQVAKSFKDSVK